MFVVVKIKIIHIFTVPCVEYIYCTTQAPETRKFNKIYVYSFRLMKSFSKFFFIYKREMQ